MESAKNILEIPYRKRYNVHESIAKGSFCVGLPENLWEKEQTGMSAEFEVSITDKDMYRFNLYHAYHGFQGILATMVGVWVLIMAGVTFGKVSVTYTALYVVFGIVFLVYVPGSLYLRSKSQIASSDVLKQALRYRIDDAGVHVSQGEQTADLEWKQIYRIVATKSQVLIYSSRVNAYVIPREAIKEQYETVLGLAVNHLERYRVKMNPFSL